MSLQYIPLDQWNRCSYLFPTVQFNNQTSNTSQQLYIWWRQATENIGHHQGVPPMETCSHRRLCWFIWMLPLRRNQEVNSPPQHHSLHSCLGTGTANYTLFQRRRRFTILRLCICLCVCPSICLSVTKNSVPFFSATIQVLEILTHSLFRHAKWWE